MWMSVLYDEGRYRLWYNLHKEFPRVPGEKPQGPCVAYAESDDGLSWRKPTFSHVKRYGFEESNIVFTGGPDSWSMELGNVFVDPVAPAEERYKMLYPTWESGHIYGAVDGVPYVPEAGVLRGRPLTRTASMDQVSAHLSRALHRFAECGHLRPGARQVRRLRAHHVESWWAQHRRPPGEGDAARPCQSPAWSPMTTATGPIPSHLCRRSPRRLQRRLYNPAYSRYEGAERAHFMFPSALHHRSGRTPVQVAVSRDNRTWRRPTREIFVPIGAPWTFRRSPHPRGARNPCPLARTIWRSTTVRKTGRTVAPSTPSGPPTVATTKPRWVVSSSSGTASSVSKPKRMKARSGPGRCSSKGGASSSTWNPPGPDPRLKVQLLAVDPESFESYWTDDTPAPGYSFADSIPLTSDELDGVVRWTHGAELGQWAGKPVRLHFLLRDVRLYAFQFAE